MKALQSAKLRELGYALAMAGILTLDKQAEALGLCRSTAWTILKGNHKASGLSATTINRMLNAPRLPPFARAKILEYVEEKAVGRFGHGKTHRHKFLVRLSLKQARKPRSKKSLGFNRTRDLRKSRLAAEPE
jgi:hypothetical protein